MIHLPRVMLAAPSSGSGKTMITCGILQAFKSRGLEPASFKCGPDYIDPMFHSRVIGTSSRNLDTFFTEDRVTRYLFARTARNAGISLLEGVMGIYDGLGGTSAKSSSYDLASVTDTPVILVVNARGMSLSVIPLIRGYLDYQERFGKKMIRGVILNQTTKMTYLLLKEQIEAETGIRLYGYVPRLTDCVVESRHLGLVTPDEISDLRERLLRLGAELETCLDMEGIIALAEEAEDYGEQELQIPVDLRFGKQERGTVSGSVGQSSKEQADRCIGENADENFEERSFGCVGESTGTTPGKREAEISGVRIAAAMDEAFCFYYQDNLELLEMMGAQIVPFSPLHDKKLPLQIDGMILGGGYPELYAKQLSENTEMRDGIREALEQGMPYLAECGGFMYLHERMEDMEGNTYPMCGWIKGESWKTPQLNRFGYITLEIARDAENVSDRTASPSAEKEASGDLADHMAGKESSGLTDHMAGKESSGLAECAPAKEQLLPPGQTIRGHEFHYFDSTNPGGDYLAKKPGRGRQWQCIHGTDKSAAGYPHLYYWSNPEFAARFLEKARAYRREAFDVRPKSGDAPGQKSDTLRQ